MSKVEETIVEKEETKVEETVQTTLSVQDLIGAEYETIVAKLKTIPGWFTKNSMRIVNVGFNNDSLDEKGNPKGIRVAITVGTRLEQYLQTDVADEADEQGYHKATTTTIFTTAIQMSAILKQIGEIQLANAVVSNPKSMLSILEGARLSVFGKEYAVDETEQNPFSSKAGEYQFEHRSIRYYPYDLQLGTGAQRLKTAIANIQAQQMLGLL
jgi:hypothetical protein